MKTNHESSHPSGPQGKSAPPGRLAIPQFDIKQVSEAAAAAVANKGSGASAHGATNPAHAQAEYRAMIQRQQQQQAQNVAAAHSSPDPPVSPEVAKAAAQNARGKAGAAGHQRQPSQGRPQNPGAQQPSNFVPPTQKATTPSIPNNNGGPPLNAAQLLIVSQRMQQNRQSQALQQAAAQQAHLRRPGIAGPAGSAVSGPGLAQVQALAQQVAAQRVAASQQLQAGMLNQGTNSRTSPTQPLGGRPPQAQVQGPPQSQQPQFNSQNTTPNPTSSTSPPTPQQPQQGQRGLPPNATPDQVREFFQRIYAEQVHAMQQKGIPADQIKLYMQRFVAQFKVQQEQYARRAMAAGLNGTGANPSQTPTPQPQPQHQAAPTPTPQARPPQAQPQVAPSAPQRQWSGTIRWPFSDPTTRQPRIIDAHVVCTPLGNGQS